MQIRNCSLWNMLSTLLISTLCTLGLIGTRSAQADTFQVTNLNPSGAGSFQQAILDANAHPGADTIVFAPGLTGTLALTKLLPVLTEDVDIIGPGANVVTIAMGIPLFPSSPSTPEGLNVLAINSSSGNGPRVTISGLTLTRYISGGWSLSPRGVSNVRGNVTLRNCRIWGLSSLDSTGAGIANAGTMLLEGCTITGNEIFASPGEGAGVYNTGSLTMTNCTVKGNLFDLSPSTQYPLPKGGGIYNAGTLHVSQCTIVANAAFEGGGSTETLQVGQGGGIYNVGTLTLGGTILDNGIGGDLASSGGSLVSQGYNLSRDSASGLLTGPGDRANTASLLGAFQNNGGPTETMLPLPGSPAINAGNPNGSSLQTDQRGRPRVSGGRMDIGAVEYQAPLDFVGDGSSDLLFQNSQTGQIVAWSLTGRTVQGGTAFSAMPQAGWKVVGSADFNGDGFPDLVFQNATTGQIAVWYLQGTQLLGGEVLPQTPQAGYSVVGVGDFNGDGKPDLVFEEQASGKISIWYLNGANVIGGAALTYVPSGDARVVGVGDFNADGNLDLLIQSPSTRQLSVEYLKGVADAGGAIIGSVPAEGWQVKGVADYNNDGVLDLVFQNSATNQVAIWLMNGLTVTGGGLLFGQPEADYKIVGPH